MGKIDFTYALWFGLFILGIISGIYLIVKDKRHGKATKAKRELQSSVYFTIVIFWSSVVTFLEIGISFI
ncbi:hypothetical protein GCM10008986_25930 [Salinibacillus aidingensis]|uniref:Uncharacterized protein n=1 Tax=Salinibacillus aidingensis TaxID=237684 RepID=A0ABP3LC46_9BACI